MSKGLQQYCAGYQLARPEPRGSKVEAHYYTALVPRDPDIQLCPAHERELERVIAKHYKEYLPKENKE